MTYAQRPKRHPMRAEKYVYHGMENTTQQAKCIWGKETLSEIYVLAFVFLGRQSAVLTLAYRMASQKIHSSLVAQLMRIYGDTNDEINSRSSERTTDTLAFTNEMLLVQMGFKP